MSNGFLPVSKKDMKEAGIKQLDFVYVIGDAYVDHPSFGHAIISRILQQRGYTVGIISQPDFRDGTSVTVLGEPRLGFLVSGGNMDSMVNHYSVSKKHRVKDAYTPGGEMGKRPDYATICYCNLIRQTYKHNPILIGGIEASLRRLGHYDYWSNKVKRSILLDSGADIISYGMGERSVVEIADALQSGIAVRDITFIDGTVYKTRKKEDIYDAIELPSYNLVKEDKEAYARSFYTQYQNTDPFVAKRLFETYDEKLFVVQNPPSKPLSEKEMDDVYDLPYMRTYHPSYEQRGGVPAIDEVKFSLISNRGCYGGCSFCALTYHQGRIIQTRSHESILEEAKKMTEDKDFKGYIHDVGGPTANFRAPSCEKQLTQGVCPNKQCLYPKPCKNLKVDHSDYLSLLRKLRNLPKVKKVFIRSGIRFDYLLADRDRTFLKELCEYHISGQLKVAPEHISNNVLEKMGKPSVEVYNQFVQEYDKMNDSLGKKQFLVPYLMSSHPGSTLQEAVELAVFLKELGYMPEQVQDFYPTPSTISTCMFYTGLDPRTMQPVYVAVNPHEKAMQRALIQYRNPANYDLVHEALIKADCADLIGFEDKCLIKPRKFSKDKAIKSYTKTGDRDKKGNSGLHKNDTKKTKNFSKAKNDAGNSLERNKNNPQFKKGKSTSSNVPADKLVSKKKPIRNTHKKK